MPDSVMRYPVQQNGLASHRFPSGTAGGKAPRRPQSQTREKNRRGDSVPFHRVLEFVNGARRRECAEKTGHGRLFDVYTRLGE